MRKLLIIAALSFISANVFAQPEWGVKGGLNIANVTNINGKIKPSIHVGVLAEFKLGNFISVQPEIMYSRQGSFDKSDVAKLWLRLNYMNIPVMLKFYPTERLSIDVGPQFGIMLNSKVKINYEGLTIKVNLDKLDEVFDDFVAFDHKNFDISLGMGATYKLNDNFDVFGRYNLGITKVFSNSANNNRNSVIQLGVGYRF